jgi:soluble lytic murein transglycosylase
VTANGLAGPFTPGTRPCARTLGGLLGFVGPPGRSQHAAEVQEFFDPLLATAYQEDRLRVEWLLHLGRNRDWETFRREYPLYRMNDDRSVRCYALLAEHQGNGIDIDAKLKDIWLPMKEADEACASVATQFLKEHPDVTQVVWLRARLGMENDRLRVVNQAIDLLNPKWTKTVDSIYLHPAKYLRDKFTALHPQTREMVSLALIRLAYLDPDEAAAELGKLRWRTQLTAEERNWVWGVIGKRAAQKLSDNATLYFTRGKAKDMHEDHLAWKIRAAIRHCATKRWNHVLERHRPPWVTASATRPCLGLLARPGPDAAHASESYTRAGPDPAGKHCRIQRVL